MQKQLTLLLLILTFNFTFSQDYFPTNKGVKTENSKQIMLTGATIHMNPLQKLDNGMLLIENGKVKAVGTALSIPKNSIIVNLEGKSVYPSFIDIYSKFGVKVPKRKIYVTIAFN